MATLGNTPNDDLFSIRSAISSIQKRGNILVMLRRAMQRILTSVLKRGALINRSNFSLFLRVVEDALDDAEVTRTSDARGKDMKASRVN